MYRLHLLGSVDLTAPGGERVGSVLSQPKRVGLLTLLVLQRGRPLSREWAASLLWPESDPARSRGSMRTALYGLRRSLGPDVIESAGHAALFVDRSRLWCDVLELEERLDRDEVEEALELYHGPLAYDLLLDGMGTLERHLDQERRALERTITERGLARIGRLISDGRADRALAFARRLSDLRPLDEAIFRERLRALAASGNQTTVAAEAQRFGERIRAELGVEPGPETIALVRELASAGEARELEESAGARDHDARGEDAPVPDALPADAPVSGGVDSANARTPTPAPREPGRLVPRRRARNLFFSAAAVLLIAAALAALPGLVSFDATAPAAQVSDELRLGEAALRNGRYSDAVEHFRRVLAEDIGAAAAWYKLAHAADWAGLPEVALEAVSQARRRAEDLPPLESRMLPALEAYLAGDLLLARELYAGVLELYPDALDATVQVAELDFHWGALMGVPLDSARAPFEALLAADSGNQGAQLHLARIAAWSGRQEEVRARIDALTAAGPSGEAATELGILARLAGGPAPAILPPRAAGRRLVRELITFGAPADVAPMIAQVGGVEASVEDQTWALLARAILEVSRGRWSAAQAALDDVAEHAPARAAEFRAVLSMTHFGGHPPDAGRHLAQIRVVGTQPAIGPGIAHLTAPTIYPPRRRLLEALLSRPAVPHPLTVRITEADSTLMDVRFDVRFERLLRAEAYLREERPNEALDALGPPRPIPHLVLPSLLDWPEARARWVRAEALNAAGRGDEALRWYRTFPHVRGHDLAYVPRALLRRAQLREARGELELAASRYRELVARLDRAEGPAAELREEAERRLAEL